MDTIMLFCEMNTKNGRKEGGREVVYQSRVIDWIQTVWGA